MSKNEKTISGDTIVAQATPFGHSGVALVRLSGQGSVKIVEKLTGGSPLKNRVSTFSKILSPNNDVIDRALITFFRAPASYTGENVVEITPHGNPAIVENIIETICTYGGRIADPGEFTKRAFINGKLDLVQVEAVAALINSKSKEAALAQQKIAAGALSKKINKIKDLLVSTLALVENEIDISEELMGEQTIASVKTNLIKTKDLIGGLLETYRLGKMLFVGLDVIIVGKTNVGKSTLFNALVKKDVSIVNQEPGTTRNLIESRVLIDGAVVRVVDTAGVRKTKNPVEKEGLERAKLRAKKADLILHLIDDPAKAVTIKKTKKKLIILTKSDLRKNLDEKNNIIHISAKTGLGVGGLLDKIKGSLGITSLSTDTTYLSTLRQKRALSLCGKPIDRAIGSAGLGPVDLSTLAFDIREALDQIDSILGKTTADEILNKIFTSFCVGK
jgi:tRNA modification GTPase